MSKITSKEIAAIAGVSPTTVSFILNNRRNVGISPETRRKVLSVAAEYGLRQKASILPGRLTIGIMTPTLSNSYYPFLIQNLQTEAQKRGLSTVILNTLRREENEQRCFEMLRNGNIDGILSLLVPKAEVDPSSPFVIVTESHDGNQVDAVSLNSRKAGYMVAAHLLEKGHRDIAYISSPFNNTTSARLYRMEGIRKRMAEDHLEDRLVVLTGINEVDIDDSAYEYDCGYLLTKRLLSESPQVTAIIAVNDETAAGCISALKDSGKVIPNDIAVCGFDNLLIGKICTPSLTSVDQMAQYAAKVGLDMLLEKITDPDSHTFPISLEYQPRLIVRDST